MWRKHRFSGSRDCIVYVGDVVDCDDEVHGRVVVLGSDAGAKGCALDGNVVP